jgi:hypothetical protein
MSIRRIVAGVVLAWVSTAAAEPRPAQVLIWGGGKTREAAEASLAAYQERARKNEWADVLTVPEGYPRIVESKSVPGLKPGFVVVVLGACEPAAGPKVLEALKAFEPAAYAREAAWAEALACPKLGTEWRVENARSWKKPQGRLTAVLLKRVQEPQTQRLRVMLLSPEGKLLDSEILDEAKEAPGKFPTIDLEEDGPVLTTGELMPGSRELPAYHETVTRYRTGGGTLTRQAETTITEEN